MPTYSYDITVSTKRLQDVTGSYKQVWQEYLTDVDGLKTPVSEEQRMIGAEGAFYKTYHFFCDKDHDIAIGDKIVDSGGNEYNVKMVQKNAVGGYPDLHHLKILMYLPE